MPKELFGTDGIRGIPGEYPLDDQTLYWIGRSIGGYLRLGNGRPRVLIGTDTRESGTHIASEIAAGLAEEGISNSFAGVISTPGVACLVRKEGFAAGVVISASHNPYHDNGVKLLAGSGMKFQMKLRHGSKLRFCGIGMAGRLPRPCGLPQTENWMRIISNSCVAPCFLERASLG